MSFIDNFERVYYLFGIISYHLEVINQSLRCWCRYSSIGRFGGTGAQATEWVSDSSVVCKEAAGAAGSLAVAATAGADVGSISEAVSYSGGSVSSVVRVNAGTTGGESVTVVGAGLGSSR